MWYWQRDRHTDHWNDIQNPGIDSHKYAQFLTKRKEQFNGGKNSLSTSSTGATGQSQMKNSHHHLNLCLTPHTKINSKLITNLNVKRNTKKL